MAKRQTAAEKLRARVEKGIYDIAGDLVHYNAPRRFERDIYDHIQPAFGEPLREVPSLEEIEEAIDALGLPRADEEDE